MTPERYERITGVLAKRQPDLTVVTDEVHKPRNIAAIVRNCDAVGIDTIHCVVPEQGYQLYMGASASAEKWVEMKHYSDVAEPLSHLKGAGYQLVAANLSRDAVDYRDIDYTVPTAIIMGAEIKGVSGQGRAQCDVEVVMPMLGMVESYNVSVANALILAEAQTQRMKAGLYDQVRLSTEVYKKRFFNWAHPVLAQYCDTHGIEYPAVREDGEVINLSQWYQRVAK